VKTPDGKLIKDAGHDVVVLKRQSDGAWLIVQHISTPEGSPGV
jgi:ketosteroid isomerase-like protein